MRNRSVKEYALQVNSVSISISKRLLWVCMDVGENYEYELILAPAGNLTDVVSPIFKHLQMLTYVAGVRHLGCNLHSFMQTCRTMDMIGTPMH